MKRSFFCVLHGRRMAICGLLVFGIAALALFARGRLPRAASPADVGGSVAAEVGTQPSAAGAAGRHLAFLEACGWDAVGPVSVETLRLPSEFDDLYNVYNRLQQAQGFNLLPFAGKTVQKYVYTITNDPAAAADEVVYANVLEADGTIVGGDICAPALDGFLHGFHGETDGYDQTG